MSAESFYRGPGKMVFGNGFYHRSFTGGSVPWYYVSSMPTFSSANGGVHVVGDTLDFETPSDGGFKGRVCTRAGCWGAPFVAGATYSAEIKVTPTIDNGHVYKVLSITTGVAGTEPSWPTGPFGSGLTVTSGGVTFQEVGAASLWQHFGPVGDDDLRMLSKNVTAGGTISLTELESNHSRIKFTGTPSSGLSVILTAGPAIGWVRTFWNTSGQTVTVKGSSGDTGVTIPTGTAYTTLSDGTNCVRVT
jgi:hypothetical protein